MDNQLFTIIIPVFNEAENLKMLHQELEEYFRHTPIPSKILFVDDGSTDSSSIILQEICTNHIDYNFLCLDKNYGLSTALKAGFDNCNTRWIGYIDADLQTSPLDFLLCFEYMGTYNMVNGIRRHRSDDMIKRISSRMANVFRNWLIKDNISDTCCPLKIMETDYIRQIPFFKGMHRFIPALVQLHGGRVKEVEVSHFPRFAGRAKYRLFNRLFHPFIDTLVFAWLKKRQVAYRIKAYSLQQNISSKENALADE